MTNMTHGALYLYGDTQSDLIPGNANVLLMNNEFVINIHTHVLPVLIPLISFSSFIALASASSTVLKRNGDDGNPLLFLTFMG